MKRVSLLLAIATTVLTGCLVTSIYPFYTDKDLAFEPALLGQWSNAKQAGEHWEFEKYGANAYRVIFSSDGKTHAAPAHLFRLQGESFLDVFNPESEGDLQPPPIPSHLLLRIFQVKPTVRMAALNYEWLAKSLKHNPKALRHHLVRTGNKPDDQRIVLTADTAELQRFLIKHLKNQEAWKDAFELKPG